jgi:hypothetical protein
MYRKMQQATKAHKAAVDSLVSAGVSGSTYLYTGYQGRQVSVSVNENGRGVTVEDSKHGRIVEANYQVFKSLYPAIAKHFLYKTSWVR